MICCKPERYFLKFTVQIRKRSSTFMPERNKLVLSANMTRFSFPEHLKRLFTKIKRSNGPNWVPSAHHIRYLDRQIFWCYYRRHRPYIDLGLKGNFWTILNMCRLFHIVLWKNFMIYCVKCFLKIYENS